MMPYKLNAEAKKVWKKVCDVMETAGTISKVDFFALELMCDAIVMYRKAHAQLSKEGFMIEGNGRYGDYQKPHPAITVRNDAFKQILSILKEFGMTPAARGQRPNSDAGSDQAKKDLMAALNPNA
jgi:P27 family predicted phage terminase small subunit